MSAAVIVISMPRDTINDEDCAFPRNPDGVFTFGGIFIGGGSVTIVGEGVVCGGDFIGAGVFVMGTAFALPFFFLRGGGGEEISGATNTIGGPFGVGVVELFVEGSGFVCPRSPVSGFARPRTPALRMVPVTA